MRLNLLIIPKCLRLYPSLNVGYPINIHRPSVTGQGTVIAIVEIIIDWHCIGASEVLLRRGRGAKKCLSGAGGKHKFQQKLVFFDGMSLANSKLRISKENWGPFISSSQSSTRLQKTVTKKLRTFLCHTFPGGLVPPYTFLEGRLHNPPCPPAPLVLAAMALESIHLLLQSNVCINCFDNNFARL